MALSIVALRAAGLGDLLTAVPALRALGSYTRAVQCEARLLVAAPEWLHPVVHLIPGVAAPVGVAGLRPLLAERPLLAFNLHGRGPDSHRALLAVLPHRLIAYANPGVATLGPDWGEDEEPDRRRWCRLLDWAGIPGADPEATGLAVPPIRPDLAGAVVLHLGGSSPLRRLPVETAVAAARHWRDHPVVLTGGPAQRAAGFTVAVRAGLDPEQILAGRQSLTALASLISAARLVVSGDTGAAHLATAYRTASVVLFGPQSVHRWGPPPGRPHTVLRAAGAAPATEQIRVADVLEAGDRHLQSVLAA